MNKRETWSRVIRGLVCVAIGIGLALLPAPTGLSPTSWVYTAVFTSVFLGLILEAAPPALVAFSGVMTACVLRIGPPAATVPVADTGIPMGLMSTSSVIQWALSGFSTPLVWLLFVMFSIGLAYEKTGLGRRLALFFVRCFGKSALGLGYAVALLDGIFAPFIPLATARSGGIVYPLVMRIPFLFDAEPEREPRKLGAYLVWVAFATSCVTSSLFLAASLPNILSMDVIRSAGIPGLSQVATIDARMWLLAIAPAGLLLFVMTPLITYWLYPPTLKNTRDALEPGRIEAVFGGAEKNRMSLREWLLLVLTASAIGLWMYGNIVDIDGILVGLGLVCLLVICDVVDWEDIVSNKRAWSTFVWMGCMITLTRGLVDMDVFDWFLAQSTTYMEVLTPNMILVGILVLFFVMHYAAAGIEAQVSVLLPLLLASASGLSPALETISGTGITDLGVLALMLPLSLGMMGVLTPYGSGQGPIWYSSGYVKNGEFWFLGLIFGCIFLAVQLLVTLPWISLSGLF